jgi:uncharacterized protein with PIN domain
MHRDQLVCLDCGYHLFLKTIEIAKGAFGLRPFIEEVKFYTCLRCKLVHKYDSEFSLLERAF